MRRVLLSLLLSASALVRAQDVQVPLIEPRLEQAAAELIAASLDSRAGYAIVESLTTEVGPRLAGTEAEERARQWAVAKLKELGFANVRVEPFELPVWTRGVERAEVMAPYPQPLTITALGGSVSTGPEGVEAELVAFNSLGELRQANADEVGGRVVFVNEPTTRTQDGSGYSVGGAKRREAAYIAEELGAKAVLIRSVGTSSHRFPHTGQMRPVTEAGDAPAGVPAAALSLRTHA